MVEKEQTETILSQGKSNNKELAISCEAFESNFADKVLLLCLDLPARLETVKELEAPCPSSGPFLNHFSLLTQKEVNRTLAVVRLTTCQLNLCPNLNPVSNLPFLGKVAERMAVAQL